MRSLLFGEVELMETIFQFTVKPFFNDIVGSLLFGEVELIETPN